MSTFKGHRIRFPRCIMALQAASTQGPADFRSFPLRPRPFARIMCIPIMRDDLNPGRKIRGIRIQVPSTP